MRVAVENKLALLTSFYVIYSSLAGLTFLKNKVWKNKDKQNNNLLLFYLIGLVVVMYLMIVISILQNQINYIAEWQSTVITTSSLLVPVIHTTSHNGYHSFITRWGSLFNWWRVKSQNNGRGRGVNINFGTMSVE